MADIGNKHCFPWKKTFRFPPRNMPTPQQKVGRNYPLFFNLEVDSGLLLVHLPHIPRWSWGWVAGWWGECHLAWWMVRDGLSRLLKELLQRWFYTMNDVKDGLVSKFKVHIVSHSYCKSKLGTLTDSIEVIYQPQNIFFLHIDIFI